MERNEGKGNSVQGKQGGKLVRNPKHIS